MEFKEKWNIQLKHILVVLYKYEIQLFFTNLKSKRLEDREVFIFSEITGYENFIEINYPFITYIKSSEKLPFLTPW